MMQDIAETFIQRANELDVTGELAHHLEFLWEAVAPTSEVTIFDRLGTLMTSTLSMIDDLRGALVAKIAAVTASLLSHPPTALDYARHNSRLAQLAIEKQKLVLVAHSQGNLFVNHAYDYITQQVTADNVKVVHIAPASPTLRGDYVLNTNDMVIQGLRVDGVDSVPASNINLGMSKADYSGHKLVETYLDGSRAGRGHIASMLNAALDSVVTPSSPGSIGSLTVTMTWAGKGDIDLHTFEPDMTHIYYQNKTGQTGMLDVDNLHENGPEHYFATCDYDALEEGLYQFAINNFKAPGLPSVTVSAATIDGVLQSKTVAPGAVMGVSGDHSPTPIFSVLVKKDDKTKTVKFTVE